MSTRLTLVNHAPRILGQLPETLARAAQLSLEQRGMEVRLGVSVETMVSEGLRLSDGSALRPGLVLAAANRLASPERGSGPGVVLASRRRQRPELVECSWSRPLVALLARHQAPASVSERLHDGHVSVCVEHARRRAQLRYRLRRYSTMRVKPRPSPIGR